MIPLEWRSLLTQAIPVKSLMILIGLFLVPIANQAVANFYVESAGTTLDDPEELELGNVQIIGETVLGDGEVLFEIAADVTNTGTAVFEKITLQIAEELAGVVDGFGDVVKSVVEQLGELAVSANPIRYRLVVLEENLEAVREAIDNGTLFTIQTLDTSGNVIPSVTDAVFNRVENIQEIVLQSGEILLEFDVYIANAAEAVLDGFQLSLSEIANGLIEGVLRETVRFEDILEEGETTGNADYLHILVETDHADAVRQTILGGEGLNLNTNELWVYTQPPAGIDADTEDAWEGTASGPDGTKDLVFSGETEFITTLNTGNLLIEAPAIHRLEFPEYDNPFDPNDDDPPAVLAEYLPFEVESVVSIGDKTHVRGRQRQLLDVLKSGTFIEDYRSSFNGPVRDPFRPELGNTFTEEEKEEREDLAKLIADADPRDGRLAELRGMQMIPWHFNDLKISEKIRLSGQVLIRSSGLQLQIKVRDAQLQEASASIDLGGELNVVLESEDAADNAGDPINKKKQRVFFLPLPGLTFNIGGVPASVTPVLSMDIGAEVSAPSRLYVPLQSSFLVGMQMGWNQDNGHFYTPFYESNPLAISDPGVYEELQASARAWAELAIELQGSIAGTINGGPKLALRASGEFGVAPLLDPWWTLDFGTELRGEFNLNFLGIEIVSAEASLHEFIGDHLEAEGPLIDLGGTKTSSNEAAQMALKPIAGKTSRWARVFQHTPASGNLEVEEMFLFQDTQGDLIAGGSNKVGNIMAKYSNEGDLKWTKQFIQDTKPKFGTAEDDGQFVIAGTRGISLWIARYDSEGNEIWGRRHDGYNAPTDMVRTEEAGTPVYYLCGNLFDPVSREYDPYVVKFDSAGTLVFAKRFRNEIEDDRFEGITVTPDGNIVLSGFSTQDVEPPALGTPLAGNQLMNASTEGLLASLSPQGDLLWATVFVGLRGMEFSAVTVDDDGTIYVGGHHSRPISEGQPVLLFGRFRSDGSLQDHVLIGEDAEWEDELPNGGNTPHDLLEDIEFVNGNLWACGSTGLGQGSAAWVLKLTPELGTLFYSVFDGPHSDSFAALADTGDGVALWGPTQSYLPWNEGGEGSNILQTLPYEGLLRYAPSTKGKSLMLQPWVYKSSGTDSFQVFSEIEGSPPIRLANDNSPVPFVLQDLTLTEIDPGETLNDVAEAISAVIQETNPSAISNLETYKEYFGIPYGTPPDGLLESAYFGKDPWSTPASGFEPSDGLNFTEVSGLNSEINLKIGLERNPLVSDIHLSWQRSDSLESDSWENIVPLSTEVRDLNNGLQRVWNEFTATNPSFLRIEFSEADPVQ